MTAQKKVLEAFIEKASNYEIEVDDNSMLPENLKKRKTISFTIKPPTLEILAMCAIPLQDIPKEVLSAEKVTLEEAIKYRKQMAEILAIMAHGKTTEYPEWYVPFFLKNITARDLYRLFSETSQKLQEGFFFDLFPDCKGKPNGDVRRFNPYRFIGSICNHFHLDYDFVKSKISFQNLLLLASSVPKTDTEEDKKEEKSNHLFDILKDAK